MHVMFHLQCNFLMHWPCVQSLQRKFARNGILLLLMMLPIWLPTNNTMNTLHCVPFCAVAGCRAELSQRVRFKWKGREDARQLQVKILTHAGKARLRISLPEARQMLTQSDQRCSYRLPTLWSFMVNVKKLYQFSCSPFYFKFCSKPQRKISYFIVADAFKRDPIKRVWWRSCSS